MEPKITNQNILGTVRSIWVIVLSLITLSCSNDSKKDEQAVLEGYNEYLSDRNFEIMARMSSIFRELGNQPYHIKTYSSAEQVIKERYKESMDSVSDLRNYTSRVLEKLMKANIYGVVDEVTKFTSLYDLKNEPISKEFIVMYQLQIEQKILESHARSIGPFCVFSPARLLSSEDTCFVGEEHATSFMSTSRIHSVFESSLFIVGCKKKPELIEANIIKAGNIVGVKFLPLDTGEFGLHLPFKYETSIFEDETFEKRIIEDNFFQIIYAKPRS